jgi:glycosyltransferase involved in cell wall biosynthesis
MPVFNGARFIRESAYSILQQSFSDLELIVVDDGSGDTSREIIRTLAAEDSRVVPIFRGHGGIAAATNAALAVARGVYFAPMDQDDVAYVDKLGKQAAFLDANPTIAVVGTGWQAVDEVGRPVKIVQRPLAPAAVAAAMHTSCAVLNPTSLMRTAVVRSVGGYRTFLPYAQDYDLWLRLIDDHDMANLPDICFSKRRHAGQVTASRRGRPAQILSGAVAYLSYLSRREFGCDRFERGNPLVPTAVALINDLLERWPALDGNALHHISRFIRYSPLAASRSSENVMDLYGRYLRATYVKRPTRDLLTALYYVVSFNLYNRFRYTDYLDPPFAHGSTEPAVEGLLAP